MLLEHVFKYTPVILGLCGHLPFFISNLCLPSLSLGLSNNQPSSQVYVLFFGTQFISFCLHLDHVFLSYASGLGLLAMFLEPWGASLGYLDLNF